MAPGILGLSPYTRVATAVTPFVLAMLVRLFVGRNRMTGILITASTVWFAANVLMAPFSVYMQQDLMNLRFLFH